MTSATAGESPRGFHEGEIAVQQQAGVRDQARQLVRMLDPVELVGGIVDVLAQRIFLALTARDDAGTLWTSPLVGPRGFLSVVTASELQVSAAPLRGDPLFGLPTGQQVGMVAMDFERRRRLRLNGRLTAAGPDRLTIEVDEAYGNCPQYIQPRTLHVAQPAATGHDHGRQVTGERDDRLSAEDLGQVRAADTFFLGTTHPSRGSDTSHRGGPVGFVRVEDDRTLWWPDYPGNNMFNSLGNLAVVPTAALLFIDADTGRSLHLTGRADLVSTSSGSAPDEQTGRRVRFHVDRRCSPGDRHHHVADLAAGPDVGIRGR